MNWMYIMNMLLIAILQKTSISDICHPHGSHQPIMEVIVTLIKVIVILIEVIIIKVIIIKVILTRAGLS